MSTELALFRCITGAERTPLLIFADWQEAAGRGQLAMLLRMGLTGPMSLGGGFGDGFGDGGDGGFGDGGFGDGGLGDGGFGDSKRILSEGLAMTDGLSLITLASGYNPFVLVGWARRGDFFVEMHGCRVVRRYGNRAQLAVIASKGPQRDTELLAASAVEYVGVVMIGRVIPCDEDAWAKECPRPKGW